MPITSNTKSTHVHIVSALIFKTSNNALKVDGEEADQLRTRFRIGDVPRPTD